MYIKKKLVHQAHGFYCLLMRHLRYLKLKSEAFKENIMSKLYYLAQEVGKNCEDGS